MATSYNGWPASPNPDAIGINTDWEPIRGHRFPGGVKAGDVETVLTYVVRQLDARVEPIDRDAIKDEWGWHYKPSANSPDTLSCHSSGTAFDYNATRHPNGHRGTFTTRQVAKIREIQAEVGGVVRWLGDATRVADEMHFEIHGTSGQVAEVAARLRTSKPTVTPSLEVEDMAVVIRRIENPNQSVLIVPDKTSKIGVRGFYAEATSTAGNEGIIGAQEVKVDKGAWDRIFNDWLAANGAVTKT